MFVYMNSMYIKFIVFNRNIKEQNWQASCHSLKFVVFLLIIIHVSGGKTHSWQVKSLLLVTKTLY